MKVIFETVPATFAAHLPGGIRADGVVQFQAQTYAAGEAGAEFVVGHTPDTATRWLSRADGRGKIVVFPPARLAGVPPVEIPASVLQQLAPDVLVAMEWSWRRVRA